MTAPLALLMSPKPGVDHFEGGLPVRRGEARHLRLPGASLLRRSPATVIASAKPGRSSWAPTRNANVAAGRK
jgi:hypothetical protein